MNQSNKNNELEDIVDENIIVPCPHCGEYIFTTKNTINCGIYRHAFYKNNLEQIPSHSLLEYCEQLLSQDLVYGCAKPFQIINVNGNYEARKCDYI